jgi:hypothetical protein
MRVFCGTGEPAKAKFNFLSDVLACLPFRPMLRVDPVFGTELDLVEAPVLAPGPFPSVMWCKVAQLGAKAGLFWIVSFHGGQFHN